MEIKLKKPFWYKKQGEALYDFNMAVKDIIGDNVKAKIVEEDGNIAIVSQVCAETFKLAVDNGLEAIYYSSMWSYCNNCLNYFKINLPKKYIPKKYWEVNEVIDKVIKYRYTSIDEMVCLKLEDELYDITERLIASLNEFILNHDAPENILLKMEDYNFNELIEEFWEGQ